MSAPDRGQQSFFAHGMWIILAIAAAKLLFHCYFNNRYGYFRDEFDYMACGDHLAWGYVDQPPLIPFLIHVCRAVLGDSLRSMRFIPALASSLLVVQTAVLAREFGGRLFALLLSAVTISSPASISPMEVCWERTVSNLICGWVAHISRFSPSSATIRATGSGSALSRAWVMQEKYSIALFGLGIVLGLLLTEQRRVFANKWIWLGGLAAFLIFFPNFLWNIHYHWPFVELMRNIKAEGRDVVLPPLHYFFQQTLLVLPLTAPIWITGLIALFFSQRLKIYRVLGWSYLICYTVFFVLHGKNYYLAPIYPMLLAAGAVTIENAIRSSPPDLDETGNRGGAACCRRTPCARGCAGSVSGPVHCVHEISADEIAGHGTWPRARSLAAVVRRPVRLGRDRGRNRGSLEPAQSGGARATAESLPRTMARPAPSISWAAAMACLPPLAGTRPISFGGLGDIPAIA